MISPITCTETCVVAPEPGWGGPYSHYEATGGPPAPAAPACGGKLATIAYDGTTDLLAPPASCTCACGGATGVTCAPRMTLFSDSTCDAGCATPNQAIGTSCTVFDQTGCPNTTYVSIGAVAAAGGSCAANPTKSVTPAAWTTTERLCAISSPVTGQCAPGMVCAPTPSFPQRGGVLCVARTGDFACPAGYPIKRLAYASFTDTRTCTTCSCGAVTGASCSATQLTSYNDLVCGGGVKTTPIPAGCTKLDPKSGFAAASTPSGGSCLPNGGAQTGEATPTSPTTICCTN